MTETSTAMDRFADRRVTGTEIRIEDGAQA